MSRMIVHCGEVSRECDKDQAIEVAGALLKETGLTHTALRFEDVASEAPVASPAVNSTWETQVVDDAARVRVEASHNALRAAGIAVDASEQYFETGTRLANVGYDTQRKREAQHKASKSVEEVVTEMTTAIRAEDRRDRIVSAREIADSIKVNGRISCLEGLALSAHAIRGICTHVDSCSFQYLSGLRDRIAEEKDKPEGKRNVLAIRAAKAEIGRVLKSECERRGDARIKLRTREGLRDVFAAVSPTYAPADAPEALSGLLDRLPHEAKATWTYNQATTQWELRANVWTPTPTDEQVVGEPFQGYASFRSADNGTSSLGGSGGIELIRCLNASVYTAEGVRAKRRHYGAILRDVRTIVDAATRGIEALVQVWGTARKDEIELPEVKGRGVPIDVAIPGFWRALLTDKRELAGVLPGRSEHHVKPLSQAFTQERRDKDRLVRSDFGQAWTRYIQQEAPEVRSEAESAIGAWLARTGRPMAYVAD